MLKKNLFIVLFCCITGFATAQARNQEADLKAVFIYNFTYYIDWDSSYLSNDFVIGVIGFSPVTASLNEIAKSNKVNNKKIIIRVFDKPGDIESCQILFIPAKLSYSLSSILEKVDKGMLTISEQPGYASKGTAFNFVLINNKLKFEANLKTISSGGLKASSQLLKLAIIIQ
ncbi:MAG: YfiR family protein [Bacteroidota bacterium]